MQPLIVYFSSKSNNTHRFVQKLDLPNIRIPADEPIKVTADYVLVVPTYSSGQKKAGKLDLRGAVPKEVIHFLNEEENRRHCLAVISSGNTNFGDSYAIAGPILASKLQVPLLYQFELLGTKEDVARVKRLVNYTFEKQEQTQNA